jgi:SUN domain-containing protein 1/2
MTYDADKTGLFDFALESAGGTIASTRCTETYDLSNAVYSVWGVPIWWARNSPRTILQPGRPNRKTQFTSILKSIQFIKANS